ncbi:hypothetical protein M433DRAFT_150136 [Acidomyces richmondensis BFW]|nr:MAG: hypothetical protein FE78DRAFT_94118 [Acidomyces sp. 'richmondensis']KYG49274.1 hypothetical protein M433DRAFT_150136 [Acidomyces richmondensis BFW]
MFYSRLLIAAAALTGLASAQNYSTSGPLSVVPNSVPYDTRLAWCRAQTNSCPMICGGQASPNTCDANSLNYTCTCTNGAHPNISAYQQTLPFFICEQWKGDCVAAHPKDLVGQTACLSVTCGTLNASSAESSSSSAASTLSTTAATSASATIGSSSSATSSSSSASSTSSSAAMAMIVGKTYGTGILASTWLALFGLAL